MRVESLLDLVAGFIQFRSSSAPDVAPTNGARLWYDRATNKLKVSKNGGAYVDVEQVTTAKLDTASVTSAKLDPTTIQVAEVALTNVQIKALRAAPRTLVAAPGAGYYLEFVSAVLFLDYGTNALTETDANLVVRYKDGSGVAVSQAIEATGFADAIADTATNARPVLDAIVAKTACDNQPLVLHNTGAGEWGGNAALDTLMRVRVAYRTLPTGW